MLCSEELLKISRLNFFFVLLIFLFYSCEKQKSGVENPEKRIAEAWGEFRLGEYKRALQFFNEVLSEKNLDRENRLRVLYGIACTHWQKLPDPDKAQAKKIFNQIISEAPESEFAAWSELALIRMDHIVPPGEKPDYNSLRQRYKVLFEKFPNSLPGQEGFIYMVVTYIATLEQSEVKKALELIEPFIEKYPDSPFISSAWSLKAKCCEILNKPDEMLNAKIKALETVELDPTNPHMDNASRYWEIAVTADYEAGDFYTAKKYYQKLIDEYPRDRRNFAALRAIKRIDESFKMWQVEEAP